LDKIIIKKYIELLGINSIENLESKDIDYWWLLKFKQIQSDQNINSKKKEELLVSINNARDELNEIEIKIIKQILNDNKKDYSENSFKNEKYQTKSKSKKEYTSDIKFDFSKEYTFTFDRKNKILFFFGFLLFGSAIFVPTYNPLINLAGIVISLLCLLSIIGENYCIKVSNKGILMKWLFIKKFIPIEIIEKTCFEEIYDQKFLKFFLNKELNGKKSTGIPTMGNDDELYLTVNAFIDFFRNS